MTAAGTTRPVRPGSRRRWTSALVATTLALVALGTASPAPAVPRVADDPAVVTHWNAVANRTIAENGVGIPVAASYLGLVSVAVYDAVVEVEGGFEPYLAPLAARNTKHASSEVAAATAAYLVLRHHFPASEPALTADWTASLAAVPNGVGKVHGTRVGRAAAAQVIAFRPEVSPTGHLVLPVTTAPGVWRPAPGGPPFMAFGQLGMAEPVGIPSATAFPLPGPDPLTSAAYARDVAEVQLMGSLEGSGRTARQTETAHFWNDNALVQLQVALRDQVARRDLGIMEAARAFAILGTSTGDAAIACWRAKTDYRFWRPLHAIHLADQDGNADTTADPTWSPLTPMPPYPEYPSGHACLTGAGSETFAHLFGASSVDLRVSSAVTGTTRTFATATALDEDAMDGRVFLGIHFRRAMVDGNALGHDVAAWTIDNRFRPTS